MIWQFHNERHDKSIRPAVSVATEGLDLLRNPTPYEFSKKQLFRPRHMGRRVVGIALLVVGLACATATSIYRAPAYADPQEQTKSILPPDNTDLLESSNYNFSSYCKILTGKDAVPQDEGNMFAQGADSLSATGGGVTKYTCSGIQMPQDQCSSLKGGKPTNGSTCTLEYTATSGVGGNDVDPQVISTMQTLVDASIAQASADAARKPLIDAFCGGLAGSEPGATGPQDYQWCTGTVSQSYDSCNANSGVRSGTLSMGDCVTNAVNTSAAPHNNVSPDAANAALQQGQTDSATTQATQTCAAKTGGAGKWKYDPDSQTCVPADSQACYQAYGSSATWVGNDDDGTGTCTPPQASDNGPVCSVGGLDFLLCPLVNLLTGLNDAFFSNIVSGVLDTSPMLGDSADNIKSAYDKILPIANIVLVIIFLIIVYSTAVGNGSGALSNYNVKKMLPRLIVAAIAMNTAWYICAAAVDLSNILGRGLYTLIASSAPNITEGFGWKTMLASIIAGGAAVAGVGIAAALMSPEILILMLLVAALGGFIAFIAGWFTMLLRNVVVTLCVLISPIAIVAFILPNTKKWADKWRNIFFTMLAMYPIIAVFTAGALFAGSAMAGSDSMFTKFGGLIVMAAPMFMLPFMVKKTSGVLGTIQDKMTNLGKSVTSKPLGDWVNKNKEGMRDRFQNGTSLLSNRRGFRTLGHLGNTLAMRRRARGLEDQAAQTRLNSQFEDEKLDGNVGHHRHSWQNRAWNAQRTLDQESSFQGEVKQASSGNFARAMAENNGDNDTARRASASETLHRNVLSQGGTIQEADQEAASAITSTVASARAAIQKHDRDIIEAIKATANTAGGIAGFRTEFQAARTSGDINRARAYAELLANSGTPGLNALDEEIQGFERDNQAEFTNTNSTASRLRTSLQADILGKFKGKDAGLDSWAIGDNARPLDDIRSTYTSETLSDNDIIGQSTTQAIAAVARTFQNGLLGAADATRLLANPAAVNMSPALRAILEQYGGRAPSGGGNTGSTSPSGGAPAPANPPSGGGSGSGGSGGSTPIPHNPNTQPNPNTAPGMGGATLGSNGLWTPGNTGRRRPGGGNP